MSREIEVLEQFFDAINRNDLQAIARDFDPQIVRTGSVRVTSLVHAAFDFSGLGGRIYFA